MRVFLSAVAVLIGLTTASIGVASAEPSSPPPGPTTTSTDDELVDMVMDAIEHGDPAPVTTPAPPPPR